MSSEDITHGVMFTLNIVIFSLHGIIFTLNVVIFTLNSKLNIFSNQYGAEIALITEVFTDEHMIKNIPCLVV